MQISLNYKKVFSKEFRKYWLAIVLFFYVAICFFIEQPRPHAVFPIGENPHTFTMVPRGVFPDTVRGKVVTLKVMTKSQTDQYYEMFSEQARRGLNFPLDTTDREWTDSYVNYQIWRHEKREMLCYAIHDNTDKHLIGFIDLRVFWRQDPGQMGFWINEKYYGGGRMREAVDLLVNAYFQIMDVSVVNAYVEPFNHRSFAACKKFGFEFVGFSHKKDRPFYYVLERYRYP
ncbi:GNAT family N-acetyltransferase [Candidatus Babeliales bacterium]|nr:GNAT family N-acetyltransferase [Candidatus Babeliales bacterium]